MTTTPSTPINPIAQALAAWVAAVEAVMEEINRIAAGGLPAPALMTKLMAAVDAARLRCELSDP